MHITQQQETVTQYPQEGCGLMRLLLVVVYDAVVVFAILMIAGAIALILPFSNQSAGKDPVYTLYLLLAWFFYPAWCWRNGGMTLGMRAWKVRLISDATGGPGQKPSWWQCVLRFVGGWLSVLPAGMGYWWMLFDSQKRSWHDRLSNTRLLHIKAGVANPPSNRSPQEIDGHGGQ